MSFLVPFFSFSFLSLLRTKEDGSFRKGAKEEGERERRDEIEMFSFVLKEVLLSFFYSSRILGGVLLFPMFLVLLLLLLLLLLLPLLRLQHDVHACRPDTTRQRRTSKSKVPA